ncbi:MAG: hypothetical protein LBB89_13200 [Treponema sp.]|jgi:hypothetical protein|nr:hypothetical protein [Treponema sp.]
MILEPNYNYGQKRKEKSSIERKSEKYFQTPLIKTVIKYKYTHREFTRYVYEESPSVQIRTEGNRYISESVLFDTHYLAYNAALEDERSYNARKNTSPVRRGDNFIETTYILLSNQYDTTNRYYYRVLHVDRWDIIQVT